MLCGWGVKAGMVPVWGAGKTVLTRAISEHFRDVFPHHKPLYKLIFYFTLLPSPRRHMLAKRRERYQ